MKNSMKSWAGLGLVCTGALGGVACGGHVSLGADFGGEGTAGFRSNGSGGSPINNGAGSPSSGFSSDYIAGTSSGGDPPYYTPLYGGTGGSGPAFGENGLGGFTYGGGSNVLPPTLAPCDKGSDNETWIAFDSDRDSFDREIYMAHPDGSELTRLTTRAGVDREPAFSPDGKWISFTSDRGGDSDIFLLELASGNVTRLTVHGNADQSSFSPNGQLVTFRAGTAYTIGVDGSNDQLVGQGANYQHPHFLGNSRTLLVDKNDEQIVTLSFDGHYEREIVQYAPYLVQAPWASPSGTDVAYAVGCGETIRSIWTSAAGFDNPACAGIRVTPKSEPDSEHPTWGPRDRIAYTRIDSASNAGQIAIVERKPDATPCALTTDDSDNRNPSWWYATTP